MSQHTHGNQAQSKTPTTTIEEIKPAKPHKTAFLDKEVIETMEDFMKFVAWSKRPGSDKKPCVVDEDLYDIITEGDARSPLYWHYNCAVVDASRKAEAMELLGCTKQAGMVILDGKST